MNDQKHFSPGRMNDLLNDQLTIAEQKELESHLEGCDDCRQQLEQLAADPAEWDKAAQHLSDSNAMHPHDWMISNPTVSIKLDANQTEPTSDIHDSYAPLPLEAPTHPEMLGRIDGFEIEKEIGRGGCGVVYKGFDRELNRPVAIKVLAPHLAANGIARQRFAREARAAAAVVHPNVVPIHGVSSEPKRPYIVMSLVNGRSLESHVREHGPLDLKDIVRISQQIADGLAAAHRQGLIHRDIKPANILLEQDVCRVMITDFGLARAADDAAITQTGWLAGTPHYMSPEQAKGSEIDQRSDLFSLGSLIYFMSTGREPFRAEKPFAVIQKIINETPVKARQVNTEVSKTLAQIIDRLLCKIPKERFQSADELHQTLEEYLAHLQNPLASPKPRRIGPKRNSLAPYLGIAAALMLGFSGWYALQTNGFFTPNSPVNEVITPGEATTNPPLLSQLSTLPTYSTDSTSFVTDDEFQQQIDFLNDDLTKLEAGFRPFADESETRLNELESIQVPQENDPELSPSGLNPEHDNN